MLINVLAGINNDDLFRKARLRQEALHIDLENVEPIQRWNACRIRKQMRGIYPNRWLDTQLTLKTDIRQ